MTQPIRSIYDAARRVSRPLRVLGAADVYPTSGQLLSRLAKVNLPRGTKGQTLELARELVRIRTAGRQEPLKKRLHRHLVSRLEAQVTHRRLSTPAGWDDFPKSVIDKRPGMWLVHGEGWYEYSRAHGSRYQSASYLCGREDDQDWAVRVPGTIRSIGAALYWLEPAPVREARQKGLPVQRQGDMYFRPMRIADHDFSALVGTRHEADVQADGSIIIQHPEHPTVTLSGGQHWRAYQQQQLEGAGRRSGD